MSESQPAKSSKLTIFASIGVVALLFSIAIVNQLNLIQDYLSRDTWVTTSATVVKVNSKTHWLTYQYEVNGQTYIGTRLSITEDTKSELGISDISKDYPEGRELTIHYNPANPSRAVINLEADFSFLVYIGLTIIIVTLAYFIGKRIFQHYLNIVMNMLTGNNTLRE